MDTVEIISCFISIISVTISIYIFVITHKTPPIIKFIELNGMRFLMVKNANNWNMNNLRIYNINSSTLIFHKQILLSTETINIDIHDSKNLCYRVKYTVYGIPFSQKVYLSDSE